MKNIISNSVNKDTSILYMIYFTFIINIFIDETLLKFILLSLILLVTIIKNSNKLRNKVNMNEIIRSPIFILIIVYIIGIISNGISGQDICFFIILTILLIVYKFGDISMEELIKFINITFFIYLILSVLLYFNIIPSNLVYGRDELNIFKISIGSFKINTFIGIEGSTADIDSYSIFIFVLNMFLNKNIKQKTILMIVSSITCILTFRKTPLIAIVISVFIYLILKQFKNLNIIKKSIFSLIYSCCFVSFLIPIILEKLNIDFGLLTHGRNVIWDLFIEKYSNLNIGDIIFGLRGEQIDILIPSWGNYFTNNPHSTYFELLIRFGIVFYIVFGFYIIYNLIKKNNLKINIIALIILIAGITNRTILTFFNPVYMMFLIYTIENNDNKKSINI